MVRSTGTVRAATYWMLPALLATMVLTSGCIGTSAQLLYVLFGHKVKAECAELEGKKIAIVTTADASSFGPDPLSVMISRAVASRLTANGKKITVIPHGEVEDWMDNQGWGRPDFKKLGKDLGADRVLAIELTDYGIHDGATLYKGHASYTLEVYDMENDGAVSYSRGPDEFIFPRDGRPAIESTERKFEAFYLAHLTDRLSKHFYSYDSTEDAAVDSALMH